MHSRLTLILIHIYTLVATIGIARSEIFRVEMTGVTTTADTQFLDDLPVGSSFVLSYLLDTSIADIEPSLEIGDYPEAITQVKLVFPESNYRFVAVGPRNAFVFLDGGFVAPGDTFSTSGPGMMQLVEEDGTTITEFFYSFGLRQSMTGSFMNDSIPISLLGDLSSFDNGILLLDIGDEVLGDWQTISIVKVIEIPNIQIDILESPTSLTINWVSISGETYIIQSSTDLKIWNDIATVVATSDASSFEISRPISSIPLFYRLKLEG